MSKSKSLKILFITYDGLTDPLGQSQILPYYLGLSKRGYKISILSNEKDENFNKNQETVSLKLKKAGINWKYTQYSNSPPIIGTLFNINRMKVLGRNWLESEGFQLFHCRSIIPALIGVDLSKRANGKLVFDIRGFWADERVEGGLWNLKNPIFHIMYKYFKKKEKWLFENADYVITLTENAKQFILKEFQTKRKIQVIPCAADLDHFNFKSIEKQKVDTLRKELNLNENDFVLTYIGSLGTRYKLKEMLLFFKQLKQENNNAKFLFISKHEPNYIKSMWDAEKLDSSDLRITSSEYKDIPNYISIGNASIFFIVSSFTGKAVSPTKQAEVMGLGLPIVANEGIGDSDQIIRSSNSGIILSSYDSKSLNIAAKNLLSSNWDKDNIRNTALSIYSLPQAIENYATVYENT